MSKNITNFGKNLRKQLETGSKTTMAELAKKLGVPTSTISRLCSGESSDPRLSTVISIAEIFKMSIDTLCSSPDDKADSFASTKFYNKILIAAIEAKDKNRVLAAIKSGATAHISKHTLFDGFECPPLQLAVKIGAINIAKALLESGADPNHKSRRGETPVHTASLYNETKAINLLIKWGAEIDSPDADGCSPLLWAAYSDSLEAAKCLIKNGADINFKGASGVTPLHRAVDMNNSQMVKLLIENGANTKAKLNSDLSFLLPLDVAPPDCEKEILEMLS